MDDEMNPGDETAIGALQRWAAAGDARNEGDWEEGWFLLGADALQETGARLAAAAVPPDRSRPPPLRLLAVPAWGEAFGASGRVFLQALDAELYVRVQAPRAPVALALTAVDAFGHRVTLGAERLPASANVFGLGLLNGGGKAGTLWHCPDADVLGVLGPRGNRLSLGIRAEAAAPWVDLGWVERPAMRGSTVRWGDGAEPPPRYVLAVIDAYTRGDPARFRAALSALLTDETGAGARAREERTWWRRLTRWEALWVRALLAELRVKRDGERFGCDAARQHPQLGLLE